MGKNNQQDQGPKQAALQREKRIQHEASNQLQAFGPVIASGSGMKFEHFIGVAFECAEAFVAMCEKREREIEAAFDPAAAVPEPPVPETPSTEQPKAADQPKV